MMRSDDQIPEWLHAALHAEAEHHEPDRARMDARVREATGRRRASWPRPAAAALAVAVTVTAITVAVSHGVAGLGHQEQSAARPLGHDSTPLAATSPSPTPSGGEDSEATAQNSLPVPAGTGAGAGTGDAMPGSTAPTRRFLTATGSLDSGRNLYYTQERVILRTDRRLTRLTVTIRVPRTKEVRQAAQWTTLPQGDISIARNESFRSVAYTFTLRPGRTMQPGQHSFALGYARSPGGRYGDRDTYSATATAAGGGTAGVHGGF